MSESFADLFEESLVNTNLQAGSIVIGTVVAIDNDHVIVNAGLKSEGVIPLSQFTDFDGNIECEIGDQVEVSLDAVEDGYGSTRLSRAKAKRHHAWQNLEKAFESQEIIRGRINGKVKGGFTVELEQIRAFLPGSLVDVRPVRDTGYLEGKELEFRVIKLDQKRNNVVVSRRAVVEQEYSEERDKVLENLIEGQEVSGVIKNLTDYGAFVDLGGIDGLAHLSDISWSRINHPSDVLEVGKKYDFKILKVSDESDKISLGFKQLKDDPWEKIEEKISLNEIYDGKITHITDYGAFVELEEGIEGLIHVSEMSWTGRVKHPSKVINVDEEVECKVLEVDKENKRISLGIKQLQSNPWDDLESKYSVGTIVEDGKVKSVTDFGVFIDVGMGIDGLIHVSDISWTKKFWVIFRQWKNTKTISRLLL